ncbi:MAG TPA: protein kinase, partial [Gemmataceae bacterium]|nr:protein kinase [Gemmataceae bacterium]
APVAVMGTPSYMAPELAAGGAKSAGPAIDVYALGAVLYECLTGRPPFRGATRQETLDQVRHNEPVAPRALQPGVPRDLETIALKCLQKEPAKRYATAAALADDLDRVLAGRPIVGRPVSRSERVVRWVRRRPAVAGLVTAMVVVAAAGAGGVAWAYSAAVGARDDAEDKAGKLGAALVDVQEAEGRARYEARDAAIARDAAAEALARATVREAVREMTAGQARRAEESFVRVPPEFRRWEWFYLKQRQERMEVLLPTPGDPGVVRFSPDGRLLAASGPTGLTVWDAATADQVRSLAGPTGALAFSPDGRWLAAAAGTEVWVWSAADLSTLNEPARRLAGAGAVSWLAFAPDGGRLAIGRTPAATTVWDVAAGRSVYTLPDQQSPAFSPDGTTLATVERRAPKGPKGMGTAPRSVEMPKHVVTLWDAGTGRRRVECPEPIVRWAAHQPDSSMAYLDSRLAFAPDGRTVAVVNGTAPEVYDAATGRRLAGPARSSLGPAPPTPSDDLPPDLLSQTWDVRTFGELAARQWPVDSLPGASFSPDGQRLARTARGGVVVRDLRGDRPLAIRSPSGDRARDESIRNRPRALACAADGRLAVGRGGQVEIRDGRTGDLMSTLPDHGSHVTALDFDADGRGLATGALDGRVRVWDLRTGEPRVTRHAGVPNVTLLRFSPDGSRVTAVGRRVIVAWDTETGTEVARAALPAADPTYPALSPDGRRLAFVRPGKSLDYAVQQWDLARGEPVGRPMPHTQWVARITYSPDGRSIVTCGNDHTARLWDAETQELRQVVRPDDGVVDAVAFSPDGRRLVTAHSRGLKLWEPTGGEEVMALTAPPDASWDVRGLAVSPDGRRIVAATASHVYVWHAPAKVRKFTMRGHAWPVRQVLLNRDGTRVAGKSWAPEGLVSLWDVAAGRRLVALEGGTGMAFSPDGTRFAAGSGETVTVYDARTGGVVRQFPGHVGGVGGSGVAFTPDGRALATGGSDGHLHLWDIETGAERYRVPTGHTVRARGVRDGSLWYSGFGTGVTAVAVDPTGAVVATGGADGTVQLWDARTGRPRPLDPRPVGKVPGFVQDLSCSADGTTLEARLVSPQVRVVWDVATGKRDEAADPTWDAGPYRTAAAAGAPVRAYYFGQSVRVVDTAPPTPEERALWKASSRIDTAWHRGEIVRYESLGRPAAALVHLDVLLTAFPEDGGLARRRAAALARFADPADARTVAAAARGAFAAGNQADYRVQRAAVLALFAKSPDRETTASAARVCALAAGPEPGLGALSDAIRKFAEQSDDPGDWCAAGWLMLRTARPADAAACFDRAGGAPGAALGRARAALDRGDPNGRRKWAAALADLDRAKWSVVVPSLVGERRGPLPSPVRITPIQRRPGAAERRPRRPAGPIEAG